MNHVWIPSQLGHGETMCQNCYMTNREAAVLGCLDRCDASNHPITLAVDNAKGGSVVSLTANTWQPIATAPKTSHHYIDLWTVPDENGGIRGRVPDCKWSAPLNCWWWKHAPSETGDGGRVHGTPTHWRHRPHPPKE